MCYSRSGRPPLQDEKKKHKEVQPRLEKEKWPLAFKVCAPGSRGTLGDQSFWEGILFQRRVTSRQSAKALAKTFVRNHTTQSGTSRLTEIIAAFIVCSLIVYSLLLNQNYQQTILLLGVYAGASFRIIPSLNRILNASLQIKTHEYLFHELEESGKLQNPLTALCRNRRLHLITKSSSMTFLLGYPGGPTVLDHVSFTVRKGEKIALVGRSGSGGKQPCS